MTIKQIFDKHEKTPDKLIEIMMEIQECNEGNYLCSDDIKIIAKEMNVPESRVYSIAEFYSMLSTIPRGKYIIRLCQDIPCYINGSFNLKEEIEELLDIKMGETTEDKIFTLEYTSCLGCCDRAPVMQIGDTVYGNLNSEKIRQILQDLRGNKND